MDNEPSNLPANIAAIVRHLMTGFGMAFAAGGYILDGQVETFVGIAVSVAGVAWSLYHKHVVAKKA